MMNELRVQNVAIIAEAAMAPGAGFTVITGETGAGKSILLGALSLVLGERASAEKIRADAETASVEAHFTLAGDETLATLLEQAGLPAGDPGELLIKREITRIGRSRCFINGGMATLAVLEQITESLVDLHGQHEHQSLLKKERQRDLLDAWGGLQTQRTTVGRLYNELKATHAQWEAARADQAHRERQLDLLQFQAAEIAAAAIRPGEIAELEAQRQRLAHAEKIRQTVAETLQTLHRDEAVAVRDRIGSCIRDLEAIAGPEPRAGLWCSQLRAADAQLAEVVDELGDYLDAMETDPERLEAMESRLDLLRKLLRKYGSSEADLRGHEARIAAELERLQNLERLETELAAKMFRLEEALSAAALALSQGRREAAARLESKLSAHLPELGFAQAAFTVSCQTQPDPKGWVQGQAGRLACGPSGVDDIEFRIAPNPGESARPVAKIASGGELSRIMLAIFVAAAEASERRTMIFDEVDAGIGGATADAVGRKLKALAAHHQIIVITHLPQVARFAQTHYSVEKRIADGKTKTVLTRLNEKERVAEIARMLSGGEISDTAQQHARELIAASH